MSLRLVLFFSAFLLLAVVHWAALTFYLYWQFLWLDLPMHLLGGICVALGWSVLLSFRIAFGAWARTFLAYMLVVMVIGVVWEVFEYAAGISLAGDSNFLLDTTLDLFFDLIGGAIGYYVAHKLTILESR